MIELHAKKQFKLYFTRMYLKHTQYFLIPCTVTRDADPDPKFTKYTVLIIPFKIDNCLYILYEILTYVIKNVTPSKS